MISNNKSPQLKGELAKVSRDMRLSLLEEGKSIYINVAGVSMYPFLKGGDRIKISPQTRPENIKMGDIVAVYSGDKAKNRLYVHRVIQIINDNAVKRYVTRGDALTAGFDKPIEFAYIAGRVTEIHREGIKISLERSPWRYLNFWLGCLASRYPHLLATIAFYARLIMEWRLLLSKVSRRLRAIKKFSPGFYRKKRLLLHNTREFILILTRKDLSQQRREEVKRLLKSGIDWDSFCELTAAHAVSEHIYRSFKKINDDGMIPVWVKAAVEKTHRCLQSRCLQDYEQQKYILKLLQSYSIPAIPLKGLFLSQQIYGTITGRGFSEDFDLLVKEENREDVRKLLENAGYRLSPPGEIPRWVWQYNFFKIQTAKIDLHWDITMMGRSKIRIQEIWSDPQLVEREGCSFYRFRQEELLLYLSAHLIHGGSFMRLRNICDIHELVSAYHDSFHWSRIIDKAQSWGLSNSLYGALFLAAELYNTSLPPEVLKRLKPSFLKRIWIKFFLNKRVILQNCRRRRLMIFFLGSIFFELVEAQSVKDYASVAKRVLFPPQEVLGTRTYAGRLLKRGYRLLKKTI